MVHSGSRMQSKVDASKAPSVVFHKTRMCRFHILGKCTRGASCHFAHSPDALRAVPDFSCTRVCPSLIETGFCNNQQCRFAHNKEQLRHRKPTDVELEAKKSRKGSSPSQMQKPKHHSSQKNDEVQAAVQVSHSKAVFLSNTCKADEEEDDLLSICCDETSWSRQTTEDLDLDIGDFGRQVSADSESEAWPTIEEVEANAKLVAAIEEPASVSPKAEQHWEHHVLLPEAPFVIKKTFIERSDVIEADLLQQSSSMRRSASVPATAMA